MRAWILILALAAAQESRAQIQLANIVYEGRTWETGGFPASEPGDHLSMAARVVSIDPRFGINLALEEITLVVNDLVSLGQVDIGGGVLYVGFESGATAEFFRDPNRDAVFSPQPPNAEVPSTFSNGILFLRALVDAVLYVDITTGAGAYEFRNLLFISGSGLPLIGPSSEEFGTLSWGGLVALPAQDGYATTCDGVLGFTLVGVGPTEWGRIKALYR